MFKSVVAEMTSAMLVEKREVIFPQIKNQAI